MARVDQNYEATNNNCETNGESTPLCNNNNGDAEMATNGHHQQPEEEKDRSLSGMMMIHRLYVVLSIFFCGICMGFSVGFYVSTNYWHSDLGRLRAASMTKDDTTSHPNNNDSNNNNNKNNNSQRNKLLQTPTQKLTVSDMITFGAFQESSRIAEQQQAPRMGFSLLNMNNDDNGNGNGNGDNNGNGNGNDNENYSRELPPGLVYFHHVEAYSLLLDGDSINKDHADTASLTSMFMLSRYSLPYFLISSGWDVQKNQAYCAVATATSILNSLRFLGRDSSQPSSTVAYSLPTDPAYRPFAYATQNDIFNSCTNQNVIYKNDYNANANSHNIIMDGVLTPPFGLSMMQMGDLFRHCYFQNGNSAYGDVDVNVQHVDHTHLTLAKMRFDLMNALEDKDARVMINYNRQLVGQVGGGHWSPLAAYSPSNDAFLVMDVAKYKYPPVWIPTSLLYDSMGTKDPCGNWDYPHAQTKLNQQERLSLTPQHYQQAMKKLNCQPAYRGYIILTFD